MKITTALLTIALLARAQQPTEEAKLKQADFMRRTMEQFTHEEKAHMQSNRSVNRGDRIKDHPSRESRELLALPDLGTGTYQGGQGGLSPGGKNPRPAVHLKAGLK